MRNFVFHLFMHIHIHVSSCQSLSFSKGLGVGEQLNYQELCFKMKAEQVLGTNFLVRSAFRSSFISLSLAFFKRTFNLDYLEFVLGYSLSSHTTRFVD